MGITLTPIHGFVKPDSAEDSTNWPAQNTTNMDKVDSLMKVELDPQQATESTALSMTPAFTVGSPICGISFTAPPSGIVIITQNTKMSSGGTDAAVYALEWRLKTGSTLDAGTIVHDRSNTRAVMTSASVNVGSPAFVGAMYRTLISTLLTPGNLYNVCTMHGAEQGTGGGTMNHREILVEMVHT